MSRVKINTFANYAGGAVSLVLGAFFVGLFFNLLGACNYAFIGIAQTLQMVLQVTDIGISASINREMARSTANRVQEPLVILRTLGLLNLAMVAMASLAIFAVAPFLASYWLKIDPADLPTSISSLRWTVLLLSCQAIVNFYTAAITGLQKQVLLNGLNIAFLALRQFGTWGLLLYFGTTIQNYFIAQTAVTFAQALALAGITAWLLRTQIRCPWFDKNVIVRCWKFSAASAGTTMTSLFVAQLDRLILASFLKLEAFGIYVLVANIANYLPRIASPLTSALYPRLTQLVETGSRLNLSRLYANGCTYLAAIVLPAFLCCAAMPDSVIFIFTGSRNIPAEAALILMLLSAATMLSSCSSIPYLIQQAHGNQHFALKMNLIYLFTYTPLLFFAASEWGAIGAAVMALALQLSNFLAFPVYSALKYFPQAGISIYRTAFFHPLLLAAIPFACGLLISYSPPSRMLSIIYCGIALVLSYACIGFGFFNQIRQQLVSFKLFKV